MTDNQNRADRALEWFGQGYNCAQAILLAYGEQFGLERELALKLALGLEGGLGRTGEVCGAVSGACLVLGLEAGCREDASGAEGRKLANRRVREFSRRFQKRYGAVACRQLIGSDPGTRSGMLAATARRVFTRRCPEYVTGAAQILEEMLNGESETTREK